MKKALGPVTLAYPMPAFLVAAYDEEGKANIMTAAWGGICCSNPPCIAVSVRPERWTHKAIVARKAFTVCVPSAAQAAMVDFAGMVSGAREDKFSATGLTAVRSKVVDAPYVDECPLVLECELQATLELGSHTQFVGRILNVGIESDCLNESGQPDMYRIDPLLYDGADVRMLQAVLAAQGKTVADGMKTNGNTDCVKTWTLSSFDSTTFASVSYTHLTLPTICSV